MRETRELRSDQEETRKSFAQAFSKACRARDSVSRPFSVSKRRKDTKTSQWDVFLRKPSPGVFLNAVPDGGGYYLSRLKSPLSAGATSGGDFNRQCGYPSRPLVPKGGTRFRGQGRLDCRKLTQSLRLCQGTPDEGSLRKAFRRKPFLPSCVCQRRLRPQGRCPRTPTAFEKAGKTFTCLAKTQARAFGLAALSRPRRP